LALKKLVEVKFDKLLHPYPCIICGSKVKQGYMPKTNKHGFFVICRKCWDKGYRVTKAGEIVNAIGVGMSFSEDAVYSRT